MIKIITDSPSDIPKELREQYGIAVMPVPITVDGVTYRETVDFEGAAYYPILTGAKELPTHAQVTMMEFMAQYRSCIAQGYAELVVVTITSKGSGIHDAACLAKKLLFEESPELVNSVSIEVIDSRGYSWAYGHGVVAGAKAVAAGKSFAEVVSIIRSELDSYTAFVALTNLAYAKRSGRITAVTAFVGEVMGFRPILTLRGGELVNHSKVRGDHKLIEQMAALYASEVCEDGRPWYVLVADSMDNAKAMQKLIAKKTKNPFGGYYPVGAAVATNSGPTIFGFVAPRAQ